MQRKLLFLISAASLVLHGCSQQPKDDWLVGSWTSETSCETDVGYDFKANGVFKENGNGMGAWKLSGDALTLSYVGRFEDGDESMKFAKEGDSEQWEITSHDHNKFEVSGFLQDPPKHFIRCGKGEASPVTDSGSQDGVTPGPDALRASGGTEHPPESGNGEAVAPTTSSPNVKATNIGSTKGVPAQITQNPFVKERLVGMSNTIWIKNDPENGMRDCWGVSEDFGDRSSNLDRYCIGKNNGKLYVERMDKNMYVPVSKHAWDLDK